MAMIKKNWMDEPNAVVRTEMNLSQSKKKQT